MAKSHLAVLLSLIWLATKSTKAMPLQSRSFLQQQSTSHAGQAAPTQEEVQAYVAELAQEVKANITAAAESLAAATHTTFRSVLNDELLAFQAESAHRGQTVLGFARAQQQELREHKKSLEEAVQYASLRAGAAAARATTITETDQRLSGMHLNKSAQMILHALRDKEKAWQAAASASKTAASQSFNEWNSSSAALNHSWSAVVDGFSNLGNAGEAVTRAGRAISWDATASRFAATLAEAASQRAAETDMKVQQAEEQVADAAQIASGGSDHIAVLEDAVEGAEEQADSAVQATKEG